MTDLSLPFKGVYSVGKIATDSNRTPLTPIRETRRHLFLSTKCAIDLQGLRAPPLELT